MRFHLPWGLDIIQIGRIKGMEKYIGFPEGMGPFRPHSKVDFFIK